MYSRHPDSRALTASHYTSSAMACRLAIVFPRRTQFLVLGTTAAPLNTEERVAPNTGSWDAEILYSSHFRVSRFWMKL